MIFTRRFFVSSLAGAGAYVLGAEKEQVFPSEIKRYTDAATEFRIFRLTDPAHQSWLAAPYGRSVSRHNDFLIHASDRSGSMQAYRMDLKSGQSHLLSETDGLMPESLTLVPGEREFCYLAGRSLYLAKLNTVHARVIYGAAEGFQLASGFSVSEDGLYATLVERNDAGSRLRLIQMRTGAGTTLAESPDAISDPQPRPKRAGVLYRRGDALWLVNYDGAQNRKLRTAPGKPGTAVWSADGRTVLYLNLPADPKLLHSIREFTPDTNEDRQVSDTTQYAAFNRNADASVFVGASGSKASPYILLLVRSVKRELALCEHRASDPSKIVLLFSPNSQRVFYQSDGDGKMAIYAIAVDRLVSETETDTP
ncbi:MAG TPA: hypothetical protein VMB25_06410 [Bryobacteraceae bacterium]|nr:hypothetical protein [Bryobacteraceae bacterium]